jgi:hypothetical protein
MDLFLLNDQFTSAKYLIRKLNLSSKLQFKLDFGHLKHRLLNLNASSSIVVVDLDSILAECISFAADSDSPSYMFDLCYKLLSEFKDLNELNNQVLVSLCEFLINKYKRLLSEEQLRELRVLQCTAKIFQILVQECVEFDSFKRHHSEPLLIIEQLLMNSHVDLCTKTVKVCREQLNDPALNLKINQLLVRYARKALEFRIYSTQSSQQQHLPNLAENSLESGTGTVSTTQGGKSRSPLQLNAQLSSRFNRKRNSVSSSIDLPSHANSNSSGGVTIASSLSSSPGHTSSFKQFYKLGGGGNGNGNVSSSVTNAHLYPIHTPPPTHSTASFMNNNSNVNSPSAGMSISGGGGGAFIMPLNPPKKEEWVKDDDVSECMVCAVTKFGLLNRRHHCRRCGRVVCSSCSQRTTLIENVARRACDDCVRQMEIRKNEQDQLAKIAELNDTAGSLIDVFSGKIELFLKDLLWCDPCCYLNLTSN